MEKSFREKRDHWFGEGGIQFASEKELLKQSKTILVDDLLVKFFKVEIEVVRDRGHVAIGEINGRKNLLLR